MKFISISIALFLLSAPSEAFAADNSNSVSAYKELLKKMFVTASSQFKKDFPEHMPHQQKQYAQAMISALAMFEKQIGDASTTETLLQLQSEFLEQTNDAHKRLEIESQKKVT